MAEKIRVTDSRERIIRAAQDLFARDGIGSVSIRSIVRKSGVNLAAVHYHFGSKDALVKEVFEQAGDRINSLRREWLENDEGCRKGINAVRHILRALYGPIFDGLVQKKGGKLRRDCEVLARLAGFPSATAKAAYRRHTDVVRSMFDHRFEVALPELSLTELELRITFSNTAVWALFDQPDLIGHVSRRDAPGPASEDIFESFIEYSLAGLVRGTSLQVGLAAR